MVRADTPSQRVQFILGTEDDDVEHVPHDLFTELDELSFRHGSHTEWKETARSESSSRDISYSGNVAPGEPPFMLVKHHTTVANEKFNL